MNKHEMASRLQLVTSLATQFNRATTEASLILFVTATADIHIKDFEKAILRAARECRFMPTPVELRSLTSGPLISDSDRAVLAWSCVLETIQKCGAYETVEFDDPIIHAAIRAAASSWVALCNLESEQLHNWTRKAFLDAYRAHSALTRITSIAAGAMPGILDADAAREGYDKRPAVRIATGLPARRIEVIASSTPPSVLIPVMREVRSIGKSVEDFDEGDVTPPPPRDTVVEDVEGKRARMIAAFKKLESVRNERSGVVDGKEEIIQDGNGAGGPCAADQGVSQTAGDASGIVTGAAAGR